tara:strand:- start:333 stop:965 length:633 start_codon:yes stop_codon:yes gene_type:complete
MKYLIKAIHPPNLGWLEKKLSDEEMKRLWKYIDNRGESVKDTLAGHVHESNSLIDEDGWFFKNTLLQLIYMYAGEFDNVGDKLPTPNKHPYFLSRMWVNYQKQCEYNPLHDHTGVYSFVIWMKIPTKQKEQDKISFSSEANTKKNSTFQMLYNNIIGQPTTMTYYMNPECEGTMFFFPSQLQHQVYPFYNCDEDRISISGNILLNTNELL